MRATRIFVAGVFAVGDVVQAAADDGRKLRVVLRARDGDAIDVVDSAGNRFDARLRIGPREVLAQLVGLHAHEMAAGIDIALAQGLPKGQKMDFVIEKATELGVACVLPFASERSETSVRTGKVERWRRIATSAAQQCGRTEVPQVHEPLTFAQLLERARISRPVLVPWELADPEPLADVLPGLLEGAHEVLVAIGPEGGFAHDEIAALRETGAHAVSLGPRIFRTETAGLIACAAIRYTRREL